MSKPYDEGLKKFVGANLQSFLDWLLPGVVLEQILDPRLGHHITTDFLCRALMKEGPFLVQIIFEQSARKDIGLQLFECNVLGHRRYKLPVYSCVVYLSDEGTIEEPPLVVRTATGEVILQFHYGIIRISEIDPEEFRREGCEGILPLLLMTKGNGRPEVVEEIIERLQKTGRQDLLPITKMFAALAFRENAGYRLWLDGRFAVLEDILSETDVYQGILQKGRNEGIAEMRALFTDLVRAQYPTLEKLAREHIQHVADLRRLRRLTQQVVTIQDVEVMKRFLVELDNR